jgi:hypothetical protein
MSRLDAVGSDEAISRGRARKLDSRLRHKRRDQAGNDCDDDDVAGGVIATASRDR